MGRPQKSLVEMELTGAIEKLPHAERERRRRAASAGPRLPTPSEQQEIDAVTELIKKAVAACRRGQTLGGKANPAFANLATLIKARRSLVRDATSRPRSEVEEERERISEGERAVRRIDEMLESGKKENRDDRS